jgi:hypothetical protein
MALFSFRNCEVIHPAEAQSKHDTTRKFGRTFAT